MAQAKSPALSPAIVFIRRSPRDVIGAIMKIVRLRLRTEIFGKDFPASAAITVAGFAQPEMMIEIQAVAVIAA